MVDEIIQPIEMPSAGDFKDIELLQVSTDWIKALLFFSGLLGSTDDIGIYPGGGSRLVWANDNEDDVAMIASLSFNPADKTISAQGVWHNLPDQTFFALAGYCGLHGISF